jgi:hypothetical protein
MTRSRTPGTQTGRSRLTEGLGSRWTIGLGGGPELPSRYSGSRRPWRTAISRATSSFGSGLSTVKCSELFVIS